jgi:hypothetical protein
MSVFHPYVHPYNSRLLVVLDGPDIGQSCLLERTCD